MVESGGTISLGGATLDVSVVDSFMPSVGNAFTMIHNETGSAISGTFDGLAQGATFEAGGAYFTINYNGGGNKDVTLTDVACYCRRHAHSHAVWQQAGREASDRRRGHDGLGRNAADQMDRRRSYSGRFVMGRKDICRSASRPARSTTMCRGAIFGFRPITPCTSRNLDGVLIKAKDLVNGVSIVQAERVEQVEYFHIELDTHDVIIAEGALSESFIDDDSRGMFHNAHEYRALYPAAATSRAILRAATGGRL